MRCRSRPARPRPPRPESPRAPGGCRAFWSAASLAPSPACRQRPDWTACRPGSGASGRPRVGGRRDGQAPRHARSAAVRRARSPGRAGSPPAALPWASAAGPRAETAVRPEYPSAVPTWSRRRRPAAAPARPRADRSACAGHPAQPGSGRRVPVPGRRPARGRRSPPPPGGPASRCGAGTPSSPRSRRRSGVRRRGRPRGSPAGRRRRKTTTWATRTPRPCTAPCRPAAVRRVRPVRAGSGCSSC